MEWENNSEKDSIFFSPPHCLTPPDTSGTWAFVFKLRYGHFHLFFSYHVYFAALHKGQKLSICWLNKIMLKCSDKLLPTLTIIFFDGTSIHGLHFMIFFLLSKSIAFKLMQLHKCKPFSLLIGSWTEKRVWYAVLWERYHRIWISSLLSNAPWN